MMQTTMSQMATQQLQQILPSIHLRDEDIHQYIVRCTTENNESLSSESSFESAVDVTDDLSQETNHVCINIWLQFSHVLC